MYLEIFLADFVVFRVFLGISLDFTEIREFCGSATTRNIRSPVYTIPGTLKWFWWDWRLRLYRAVTKLVKVWVFILVLFFFFLFFVVHFIHLVCLVIFLDVISVSSCVPSLTFFFVIYVIVLQVYFIMWKYCNKRIKSDFIITLYYSVCHLQVISYCQRKSHKDVHRFEKISNIIKQFKLSCR